MHLFMVATGFAAGILSGLFGIGGGVLIVVALVLVARYPMLEATGTSLGALLLPVGLLGVLAYHRAGNFHLVPAMLIALGLFGGSWFGARFAMSLGSANVQRAFALFLMVMAVRLWLSAGPR